MAYDWGGGISRGGEGAKSGFAAGGPWGAAAGGALGLLSGFIPQKDPFKEANKYLDQIPDELKQYLMPYIKWGKQAHHKLNDLSNEYRSEYEDPNAIISRIGAGYKESPGYQWRLNQGENAINNAAATNGMAGTAQHQQQAGELADNLASQDYETFLNHALGLRSEGLTGRGDIEKGFFNTGAGASGSLAASLANLLKSRAYLGYENAKNKNKQLNDALSSVFSMGGSMGGGAGGGGSGGGSSDFGTWGW